METIQQLKYYINPGCPPIRTLVEGNEPFMRPEVGFNPSWFYRHCQVDFSEKWHRDIAYRLEQNEKMQREIRKRFPGYAVGGVLDNKPPDLLTGIYGIGIVDMLFGRSLQYSADKWPVPVGQKMDAQTVKTLKCPDLTNHPFMAHLLDQIDGIFRLTGSARGYLNWQGNLNTAFRFRGEAIFTDLITDPGLSRMLLDSIAKVYLSGVKMIYEKQRFYGIDHTFATIANCTVNMVGPGVYADILLDYDIQIARQFDVIGIHNCAWTVTPYLEHYRKVPRVGYLDMGIESDLALAKKMFPAARRNCLYKSVDLKNKSRKEIRKDFQFIADNLAPCDVGLPDIEYDVPDDKIMFAMDLCAELSKR
jgi:hypothetical protein